MKALTLLQPWAALVAIGAKKIETRSFGTDYRGLLAIHSSKRLAPAAVELWEDDPAFRRVLVEARGIRPGDVDRGCVSAIVELLDVVPMREAYPGEPANVRRVAQALADAGGVCGSEEVDLERELAFGDWSVGRHAWIFGDRWAVQPPMPMKGALGVWAVGTEFATALRAFLRPENANVHPDSPYDCRPPLYGAELFEEASK